ncbi:hypothetical protein Tco_0897099, partial [Tanacetum coccineum]
MTDKYCPRGEIKKIEVDLMFPEESDKIEKYVEGLLDMIHGSVMAFKLKTMQYAIEFATEFMDGNGYPRKRRKTKPKRQKPSTKCEEREKSKSTKAKVKKSTKVNSGKVNGQSRAKAEEILNGP